MVQDLGNRLTRKRTDTGTARLTIASPDSASLTETTPPSDTSVGDRIIQQLDRPTCCWV